MRRVSASWIVLFLLVGTASTDIVTPSAAQAAPQQPKIVTETVRLQHIKAADFISLLRENSLLTGKPDQNGMSLSEANIVSLKTDTKDNQLVFRGTASEIAALKQIVRLLDVEPRLVRIQARLIETNFDAQGKLAQRVQRVTPITLKNNAPTPLSFPGFPVTINAQMTPHINGDSSISMTVTLQANRSSRYEPGKVEFAGVTTTRYLASQDKALLRFFFRQQTFQSSWYDNLYVGPYSDVYPRYELEFSAAELKKTAIR